MRVRGSFYPEHQPTQALASQGNRHTSTRRSLCSKGSKPQWADTPAAPQAPRPARHGKPNPGHKEPPKERVHADSTQNPQAESRMNLNGGALTRKVCFPGQLALDAPNLHLGRQGGNPMGRARAGGLRQTLEVGGAAGAATPPLGSPGLWVWGTFSSASSSQRYHRPQEPAGRCTLPLVPEAPSTAPPPCGRSPPTL